MTSICDTRLLLTFKFPPSLDVQSKVRTFMDAQLRKGMVIPTIVITEYIKIAGGRVGLESALTHISELEARGASVAHIDRDIAILAGRFLLGRTAVPFADALIGATAKILRAERILSDDPHFKTLGIKTLWF